MPKHNKTGRSARGDRYVLLPFDVLQSSGFANTAPPARAVLLALLTVYNGSNNGRLALSVRDAASACNIGTATAARAFQQLEDAGLIETTEKGSFRAGKRWASTYRITWRQCDVSGTMPSGKYRKA
jgi:hypothetical protein